MKPIDGYFLIRPEDLCWAPSNMTKISNADFLERTRSEILGARLWRLPTGSANTLHKHHRAEEFYFVVEGTSRIRVDQEMAAFYPVDPKQLPAELAGAEWPPKS